jgi:hypothetical protein
MLYINFGTIEKEDEKKKNLQYGKYFVIPFNSKINYNNDDISKQLAASFGYFTLIINAIIKILKITFPYPMEYYGNKSYILKYLNRINIDEKKFKSHDEVKEYINKNFNGNLKLTYEINNIEYDFEKIYFSESKYVSIYQKYDLNNENFHITEELIHQNILFLLNAQGISPSIKNLEQINFAKNLISLKNYKNLGKIGPFIYYTNKIKDQTNNTNLDYNFYYNNYNSKIVKEYIIFEDDEDSWFNIDKDDKWD